jgi:apocytochrome f
MITTKYSKILNSNRFNLKKNRKLLAVGILTIFSFTTSINKTYAYPIFAQNTYENPRDPTGRIVCSNCHLSTRPIELESPSSVLPDSLFDVNISIPYDIAAKQVTANGTVGPINIGAVLILPEGFKLSPPERLSSADKTKTKGVFIQPYSKERENILVVGPISGEKNGSLRELTFPILAPDPAKDSGVNFLNYPIYAGGNRGRGQVYPTGDNSNNLLSCFDKAGKIETIYHDKTRKTIIELKGATKRFTKTLPDSLTLLVKEGDNVEYGQQLTSDPNVGGFGQEETEINLSRPETVKGIISFFISIACAQLVLVLKKRQFDNVQKFDKNF